MKKRKGLYMILEALNVEQVENIYNERMSVDFLADEIRPLTIILYTIEKGMCDCYGLYDGNELIGYAFLLKKDNNFMIDYLAISPEYRNKGIGAKMLKMLKEHYADADNILLEVEDPDKAETDEDRDLQSRRRAFYLRNGCTDTGLRMKCFQVPFQILVLGNSKCRDIDSLRELYVSFYRMILPKEVFERNIAE